MDRLTTNSRSTPVLQCPMCRHILALSDDLFTMCCDECNYERDATAAERASWTQTVTERTPPSGFGIWSVAND